MPDDKALRELQHLRASLEDHIKTTHFGLALLAALALSLLGMAIKTDLSLQSDMRAIKAQCATNQKGN